MLTELSSGSHLGLHVSWEADKWRNSVHTLDHSARGPGGLRHPTPICPGVYLRSGKDDCGGGRLLQTRQEGEQHENRSDSVGLEGEFVTFFGDHGVLRRWTEVDSALISALCPAEEVPVVLTQHCSSRDPRCPALSLLAWRKP